jgi:hypothetical protein
MASKKAVVCWNERLYEFDTIISPFFAPLPVAAKLSSILTRKFYAESITENKKRVFSSAVAESSGSIAEKRSFI